MSHSKYFVDEEIVIKPPTELIPDEYKHTDNKNISVFIFKKNLKVYNDCEDCFSETLTKLNYSVQRKNIYTLDNINFESTLKAIQNTDFENSDGVIFLFACEIKQNNAVQVFKNTKWEPYEMEKIWKHFISSECPQLRNKPKIFIFNVSKEVKDTYDDRRLLTVVDEKFDSPAEADLLIIYHRNTDQSTYEDTHDFMSQFCSNIEDYGDREDLVTLSTCVISKSSKVILSTLTRKFYPTISEYREHYLTIKETTTDLLNTVHLLREKLGEKLVKKEKKSIRSSFRIFFGKNTTNNSDNLEPIRDASEDLLKAPVTPTRRSSIPVPVNSVEKLNKQNNGKKVDSKSRKK